MSARVAIAGFLGMMGLLSVGIIGGNASFMSVALGLALIAAAVYLFRGKGAASGIDTWEAMQHKRREDAERRVEEQKSQRRKARADFVATILGRSTRASSSGDNSIAAAQISAIANPETARAIQNLQNLLYTQAITDEEFQSAKDRLLRSSGAHAQTDTVAQVMRLAELHEAGVLSDVEFNAAKLRALGLG